MFEWNTGWYPSLHSFHAALFVRGEGYSTVTGAPSQIIVFDQFKGLTTHTPGTRTIRAYTEEQKEKFERLYKRTVLPCDNANEFCVVLVS